jgi:RHS repeat-associated protein
MRNTVRRVARWLWTAAIPAALAAALVVAVLAAPAPARAATASTGAAASPATGSGPAAAGTAAPAPDAAVPGGAPGGGPPFAGHAPLSPAPGFVHAPQRGGQAASAAAQPLKAASGVQARPSAALASSAGAITGYAGKCVDDYQQSKASGTEVDLYDCVSQSNQQWTLNSSGELVNTLSGLCLSDSGNGGAGTGLIQYACNGSSNEVWTYNSSDQYVLSSNGLCLNDPGNITTNSTQLVIWTCGNFTDEQWSQPGGTAPPLPTGAITGYGGKCVDDYGQSKSNSTKIDLYDCVGQSNQQWTLNSYGELVNNYSGLCLNDSGYGGSGTGLVQYSCSSADTNETWTYDSGGHYVLAYNGLCLNDPGDSTTNGTQLIIYACGNYANESWSAPGTPSVPSGVAFSPDSSGNAESLTPSFSASYSDTTGSSGYDQFQVLDSSGAVVATGNGSTVSSGGTSTWTPSTQLQVGGSYKVEARAYFGGYSTWSAGTPFYADPRMADGVHPWSTYIKVPLDKWTTAQANVASGGLQVTSTGLSLPGAQLPFHLNFWYNSPATGASNDPGTIAPGWTDSLSARLVQNGDGSVTYFEPDGSTSTFTPDGSNGYNRPGGLNASLDMVSGGGWTLTWHSAGTSNAQGEVDTFNSSGQLTKQAAASGEAITITYTSGQPSQVTDTEGRVINLTYNSSSDLTEVDDTATGRTWPIGYDASGYLNSITDPASGVTKFTNNSSGDVTAISSPDSTSSANHTADVAYNSSGQVSTLTQMGTGSGGATNPQWGFTYGTGTTNVKDPNGNTTTYDWDNAGRVTQVTDALGQTKYTSWTPDNNIASTKDAQGNVTSFTWDPTTDVLDKMTLPTGAHTTYTYGDSTNPYVPTQITDAQGNVFNYSYDSYGQVTQATDGLSSQNTTSYYYQGVNSTACLPAQTGQLCYVTNQIGSQTQYGYNSSGQVTSIKPPSPLGTTSVSYDGDGNPAQVTTPRGATTYSWDLNGDMVKAKPADANGSSVPQWSYDADGNLTKRSSNVSQSFTWDALGRLATSTDTDNNASTYSYDSSGNLTSLQDPAGTTTYTPNQVNEPSKIVDPWGGTTILSYESGNDTELAKIAFPNGVSESFSYDNSGRPTGMDATTSSGTTLIKETGNFANSSGIDTALLQSGTDTAGDTTQYGYDVVNRLTSATTKSTSGSTVSSYGYSYDGAGNMTSQTVNGTQTSYSYNAASELSSQGATYNAAGDLTGGAGFSALAYDDAGQTTSVTPSGGTAASLSYVAYSQDQLYQAGDTTLEPTAIGIAATVINGTTTGYAYTPGRGLLAENTNGSTYYYLLDPFGGSVVGLTDSSGNLADNYTYSPYGQQTAVKSTVPNLFGYDGGLQASGTGLIHFGARYYNPALGQWTQLDPSGQDLGYVYAGDNPVNYADPTGYGLFGAIIGIASAIGTAAGIATLAIAGAPEAPLLVGLTVVGLLTGNVTSVVGVLCGFATCPS